ncbi:MAG: hypothetical protein NTU52_07740 [Actinobacteria bacterium]|nr:hypothetical protein [Actinomycetota bacterium]
MHKSLAIVDEMYLEGLAMKRAQIRRERPDISDDSVEQLLQVWITNRPMDAPGRVRLT